MTVFLCGFMGCGKSTVGARLAKALDAPFVDMDTYIEEHAGMKIPEIFSEYGEEHFREMETRAVSALSGREGVIACGGGAMLREENAQIARKTGIVIYLQVSFRICYARIANTDRPIVRRSTRQELEALYKKRQGIYKQHSTYCIEAEKSPSAIVSDILEVLQKQS